MSFPIANYLQNYIVRILVPVGDGEKKTPMHQLAEVYPRKIERIPLTESLKYLTPGVEYQILIRPVQDGKSLKNEQVFVKMTIAKQGIKQLHIGMLTTRYEQGRGDDGFIAGGVAIQGRPWIKIHNRTLLPLRLNGGKILIPAMSWSRYKGDWHMGVPLGFNLKDKHGLYPDFTIEKPVTDVYYGMVSDLLQPLYGGFMMNEMNEADNEPTYLEEDGWYG